MRHGAQANQVYCTSVAPCVQWLLGLLVPLLMLGMAQNVSFVACGVPKRVILY